MSRGFDHESRLGWSIHRYAYRALNKIVYGHDDGTIRLTKSNKTKLK